MSNTITQLGHGRCTDAAPLVLVEDALVHSIAARKLRATIYQPTLPTR
jgi:hypothetical protein